MTRPAPARRNAFKAWQTFATRWSDNDVYGHVNNTVYYEWFDTAVNAWLIGAGLLDIASGDPIALVAETRCTFFAALAFPEPVEVGLAIARLGKSSIRYRIGIFAQDSETAAAEGEFVHVVVDRTTHRPVDIPSDWRTKLARLA